MRYERGHLIIGWVSWRLNHLVETQVLDGPEFRLSSDLVGAVLEKVALEWAPTKGEVIDVIEAMVSEFSLECDDVGWLAGTVLGKGDDSEIKEIVL